MAIDPQSYGEFGLGAFGVAEFGFEAPSALATGRATFKLINTKIGFSIVNRSVTYQLKNTKISYEFAT